MRRIVGLVLVAVGTAFVGLAVALPSYAYPRITEASVPESPDSTIISRGDGVTVLKVRAEKVEPVTDTVYVTRFVTKDPLTENRPSPPDDVVQWRLGFSANLKSPDGDLLNAYLEGYTLDKIDAEADNCCSDYVQLEQNADVVPIRHEGLGLKFPLDTKKQSYKFWDVQLRRAQDATFDGTESLFGLQTYRFVQDIKDQTVGTQELPGALFGDPAGAVTADEVYSTRRTLWVEPRTGAIIKGSEDVNWRFLYQGTEVPRTVGTLAYTDETVKAQVDEYKGKARDLQLLKSTAPLILWIVGPLMVLAGIALLLLGGGRDEGYIDEYSEDGEPANA